MSKRGSVFSTINYKRAFLGHLDLLLVFGIAIFLSHFAGSRVNPTWLGYSIGFVVTFFAFGIINQLIKLIRFRSDSRLTTIPLIKLIAYFTICVALLIVLATQWQVENSSFPKTVVGTSIEVVGAVTTGIIVGIVSIIILSLIVLVIDAVISKGVISWIIIGLWDLTGGKLTQGQLKGILFSGILSCGILGMINGAIGTRLILGSDLMITGLGALGGAMGGAVVGGVVGFFAMILMKMATD